MLYILGLSVAVLFFIITYFGKHLTLLGAILISSVVALFGCFELWDLLTILFVSYGIIMIVDKATNKQKVKGRSAKQIISNGIPALLAVILLIITNEKIFVMVYAVGIGEVFIDSLASDIGVLSKCAPIDIFTWKITTPGLSGGVSLLGTSVSFVACTVFGGLVHLCIKLSLRELLLIILLPFFGSIIDSILGSCVQSKYICTVCDSRTDNKVHCENQTQQVGGIRWIDNCTVNFLSNALVCIICFILLI